LKVKRWQKRILWRRRFFRVLKITLLLVIFIFSGYGIYNFLIHSPYFKIKEIRIEGNHETDREDILSLIDVKTGENIFKVKLKQAELDLRSLKQIKNAQIQRNFPDTIMVKITERVPIAELDGGDNVYYNKLKLIDEEGIIFFGKRRKIPKILGAKDALERRKVVNFLAKLRAVDLSFYEKITYIDGSNPRNIRLKTDGWLLIWGPAGEETEKELEKKLAYLDLVLKDLLRNSRTFNYLDLRFLKGGKGEIIVG
jgi:cell division protein FtsQ